MTAGAFRGALARGLSRAVATVQQATPTARGAAPWRAAGILSDDRATASTSNDAMF